MFTAAFSSWSEAMTRALGARGAAFKSRTGPRPFFSVRMGIEQGTQSGQKLDVFFLFLFLILVLTSVLWLLVLNLTQ